MPIKDESKAVPISTTDNSWKINAGSETLKTKFDNCFTKLSETTFVRFKNNPNKISRKIGKTMLNRKIIFSILIGNGYSKQYWVSFGNDWIMT